MYISLKNAVTNSVMHSHSHLTAWHSTRFIFFMLGSGYKKIKIKEKNNNVTALYTPNYKELNLKLEYIIDQISKKHDAQHHTERNKKCANE